MIFPPLQYQSGISTALRPLLMTNDGSVSTNSLRVQIYLVISLIKTFIGWSQHSGKYPNQVFYSLIPADLFRHFHIFLPSIQAPSSIPHQLKGKTHRNPCGLPLALCSLSPLQSGSLTYVVATMH